ncbi:NADPH:quinone reductase-like Zn-dependent oxidoreductase [Ancylobacter sp. 3268]|uniref:zinc-dependent alcohol dehydrogenase n=1 Tax=Ancylobacter sp. 3268 TaxID=2817752 RepID=UPI00285906F6|nr:zinc-binding alcohol dehydrogenase [Ancylobacter sp. 3268]MDR6952560.1 NADPH:quinone reductase-like Zn-dependent oxidoreductase [Ancylobacter sp. 3268]
MPAPVRTSQSLWCIAPGRYEIRADVLSEPEADTLTVRALASCVSRGSERLVLHGNVPTSELQNMRAPFQQGEFPFPVQYGYQSVGLVESGPPALIGRTVFSLFPHQDVYQIPASAAVMVLDDIPAERAALAANMETALNAMWDAGAGPGDRVAIVGGGVVGLMLTALAAGLPGADVTLVDVRPERARFATAFGAKFALPAEIDSEADIVFHTSASAEGLQTALGAGGFEAKVVELSWYGKAATAVALGGSFHSRRLRLIGSQVGAVSPERRPRWPHARRLAKALSLLSDARFDPLITHRIPFSQAPKLLPQLINDEPDALAILLTYG